jgi:hypothetical protein
VPGFAQQGDYVRFIARAPKARAEGSAEGPGRRQRRRRGQKVARGKREARSPWIASNKKFRPGGPTERHGARGCRPFGARALFGNDPGAACSLRFALAPGYPIPRLRRSTPLLPWRTSGARRNCYLLPAPSALPSARAPPALDAPASLARLRRSAQLLPSHRAPSALSSEHARLRLFRRRKFYVLQRWYRELEQAPRVGY